MKLLINTFCRLGNSYRLGIRSGDIKTESPSGLYIIHESLLNIIKVIVLEPREDHTIPIKNKFNSVIERNSRNKFIHSFSQTSL